MLRFTTMPNWIGQQCNVVVDTLTIVNSSNTVSLFSSTIDHSSNNFVHTLQSKIDELQIQNRNHVSLTWLNITFVTFFLQISHVISKIVFFTCEFEQSSKRCNLLGIDKIGKIYTDCFDIYILYNRCKLSLKIICYCWDITVWIRGNLFLLHLV